MSGCQDTIYITCTLGGKLNTCTRACVLVYTALHQSQAAINRITMAHEKRPHRRWETTQSDTPTTVHSRILLLTLSPWTEVQRDDCDAVIHRGRSPWQLWQLSYIYSFDCCNLPDKRTRRVLWVEAMSWVENAFRVKSTQRIVKSCICQPSDQVLKRSNSADRSDKSNHTYH